MDDINFWFWVAVAAGCYAFVQPFRQEVNGWIVSIADKVKNDTLQKPKELETSLLEDVAFEMFKRDFPRDPSVAGGRRSIPSDMRAQYIIKAFEPVLASQKKTVND